MTDHPQGVLELYALGTLEGGERDEVEDHLAACDSCCAEVERLQNVTLALDDAWPAADVVPFARPKRPAAFATWLPTAAALALAVGTGTGWYADRSHAAALVARDDAALATVATSHFMHASFAVSDPALPAAKAIYARDASWLLVVVDANRPDLHVRAGGPAGETDLGALDGRGTTSLLYAKLAPGVRDARIVDAGGKTVATVTLVLPAAPKP